MRHALRAMGRGLRAMGRGLRAVGSCLAHALGLAFALAFVLVPTLPLAADAAAAHAAASAIDGISDQSLPAWDGGFAGSDLAALLRAGRVGGGGIRYARYVVQWNVMAPAHAGERATFEAWLGDVASLGLTPDVALSSFDGVRPASPDEYAAALAAILGGARAAGHPLGYVEAWNEPNNQGAEGAAAAARLANAAEALCGEGFGCAVVAGDFEDGRALVPYELAYERNLDFAPAIWGVHPYFSVEEMSEAPYLRFLRNLPRGGVGAQVWITEIAARRCTDYGGVARSYGEVGQARRAAWLVDTLLRNQSPANAFYYELLLAARRQPGCSAHEPEDDALYEPAAPPSLLDRPRAAAGIVWGGGEGFGEVDGPGATAGPLGDPGSVRE